jgi:hypothetical protein
VTFGVAPADPRPGASQLWEMLHDNPLPWLSPRAGALQPMTWPRHVPAGPWCAVRFELGLAMHQQAADWLGDFERCIAWAWLDARARDVTVGQGFEPEL